MLFSNRNPNIPPWDGSAAGKSANSVLDRGDEEVAEHGGEAAGEDDGAVVAVGDVVGIVGVAVEEFADEAGTATGS